MLNWEIFASYSVTTIVQAPSATAPAVRRTAPSNDAIMIIIPFRNHLLSFSLTPSWQPRLTPPARASYGFVVLPFMLKFTP